MPEGKKSGRKGGCFKYGCLACVGLLVLLLITAGTIMAIGLMLGAPEEKLESPQLSRELPAALTAQLPAARVGRIILDLSEGSFRIIPVAPGEPIKVDGRYDSGVYELAESFEQQEGESWVYRVSFDRRVSWVRAIFKEMEQDNRINISIPRGTPIILEGTIGVGESILELGGLAVRKLDLNLGTGSHEVSFSEPSPLPMESFDLAGGIGELRVSLLGNASPERVKVSHRIGEVNIDLRGAWVRDADAAVRCGIGECAVRVPEDIGVEVISANVTLGETSGAVLNSLESQQQGKPTLRLDLSGRIGEVRVTQ
jgi:hypothetical protein